MTQRQPVDEACVRLDVDPPPLAVTVIPAELPDVRAGRRRHRTDEPDRRTGDPDRRAADADLRAELEEWRQLVEAMPQIVWITRPDGWHVHFNRQWMAFTGLTLEESLGFGWNPPFHPDDRERAAALWEQATSTGEPYEIEYRLRRADGVYHWMLGRAMPLRDADGTIVRWFGTCTDIEELKQAQARIDEQAKLLDQTQDAILVHDLEHRIIHWNQGAERIHGWTAAEAVGCTLGELVAPDATQVEAAMRSLLRFGEWRGELHYVDRDGNEVVMEGRWSLLYHDDGTPRAALAVNTDVTQRRRIEAEYLRVLEARATQDPLTGLPNRTVLFERLEFLLGQRHRAGIAVAFIDLDGFKPVNDRLGHAAGDKLLLQLADRLRATIRGGDVAARIGGDEFVVVGQVADENTARGLGERLTAALRDEIEIDGHPVVISASVGVEFVGSDDEVDVDTVLSRADAAMYAVKRSRPDDITDPELAG